MSMKGITTQRSSEVGFPKIYNILYHRFKSLTSSVAPCTIQALREKAGSPSQEARMSNQEGLLDLHHLLTFADVFMIFFVSNNDIITYV